ncbi:probable 3-hydroxyisobutyrate dehydrogenase, mitochondrial isoform X5 [Magnolia sinica]|uniref:probable 3-hydroxyisobutyrate dehydrogenase, mitochondrial isoform X5 n=1 Tax=Magnolia sinica TaxID=86752 RepID=UPI00265A2B25|nr:probable 3-hydroxyisobutyrate dehydrogenase, mitochondrial isoform X5 [Magnolia sinica]
MAIFRARAFKALSELKSNLSFSQISMNQNRRCSSIPIQSQLEGYYYYFVDALQRVGFIGLGNMGFHMANNLVNAGFKVVVHDINRNATKKFSDKGVPTKETPLEVAESSDVIITMLPSSSHVLDVYTGANGLLHGENLLRPWLLIDSSTVDPHTSRRLSESISKCVLKEKKGYAGIPVMLDAPVSGGVLGAEAGTLTFMAAKICNNIAMAVSMLGVSEAFALGQSLGITASTLTNIFNSSSACCWSSDTYNPVPGVMDGVPSSRNYVGGFSSKLMAKDLELAAVSAEEVGLKCPFSSQAREIYAKLCEEGHEYEDFSCAFRHYYSGKDERSPP